MLSEKDLEQLSQKGISEERFLQQLSNFKTGFPYPDIQAAASVDNGGIHVLSIGEQQLYADTWNEYMHDSTHRVVKFVPASGAASRMFKELYAFLESDRNAPETSAEQTFFAQLSKAPFSADLDTALTARFGKKASALVAEHRYKDVVDTLLNPSGLGYGHLPKALLKFHRYTAGSRTAFEEHLVEGLRYACDGERHVRLHFTVSPEHRSLFRKECERVIPHLEKQEGLTFEIDFSEQKSSTDTVAANPDGSPFRLADGSLLFRPGGHGALIENLNDIDADIIFVKTVDNVAPDALKADTVTYKRLLAGMLISLQSKIFAALEELDSGDVSEARLRGLLHFVESELHCHSDTAEGLEGLELLDYLYCRLNRPLRVCGMVRNDGEPGGGPFLVYNGDSSVSLQILESSQIDMSNPAQKALFERGTHFNPVDLVCGVKDFRGEKFHLPDYVDPSTGFISQKSKDGRELLALELPGLWNGAMSDWNTVFVEVPLTTFNPVKTVNDLFRPQHQEI